MVCDIFAAIIASIQSLCICVRLPASSAWFPGLCGSSMCDFALVPGESAFAQLFWGVLTHSDVFSDPLESFVVPCTRAHVSNASVWLSSLSGSLVYSSHPWEVSSASDAFSSVFELLATLCSFMHGKFSVTDVCRSSRVAHITLNVCADAQYAWQLSSPSSVCSLGLSGSPACDRTAPLAGRSGLAQHRRRHMSSPCMPSLSLISPRVAPKYPNGICVLSRLRHTSL